LSEREVSFLQEYGAESLADWCVMFQCYMVSSSRVNCPNSSATIFRCYC